jgi:hypothetical protein
LLSRTFYARGIRLYLCKEPKKRTFEELDELEMVGGAMQAMAGKPMTVISDYNE